MSVNEPSVNIWDPINTMVLIQPKGFGFPVYAVDPRTQMDALAGGDRSFESLYSSPDFWDYVRTIITSNPGRITGTLRAPFVTGTIPQIRKFMAKNCPGNIYIVTGCAPDDQIGLTGFRHAIVLGDTFFTNSPVVTNGALVLGGVAPDATSQDMMSSGAFTSAFAAEVIPTAPTDIRGTVATGAANQIIALKRRRCAGQCGDELEIEDEWIFVTDAPGGGYTAPRLYYSSDRGANWTQNILTGIADGNALTVDVIGNTVVVGASGTDAGAYHMSLDDVIDGTATGTEATGLGTNQVNSLMAIGGFVVAVGQAGRIWYSRDGGFVYEVLAATTVITSQNLNGIAAVNSDQVWCYGAAGTLVRIKNLVNPLVELITTGVADDFLCGAVPPLRANELFLGTDAGEVYVSINASLSNATPDFTARAVGASVGAASTIDAMSFGGIKGNTLALVQSNATPDSRILIDHTGGALGHNTVVLGTFAAPANNSYNSIALATQNFGIAVGEVETTYATIVAVS